MPGTRPNRVLGGAWAVSVALALASCGLVDEGSSPTSSMEPTSSRPDDTTSTATDAGVAEEGESNAVDLADEELEEIRDFFERNPPGTDGESGESGALNIVTFDGLQYRIPISGDFVSVLADDRSVVVQIRIEAGDMTNVAAVVTDYPVEITGDGTLTIDGEVVELADGTYVPLIDNAAIFREGDVYTLGWPGEGDERFRLDVTIEGDELRITTFLPPALEGLVNGLNGDGDGSPENDLTSRSGGTLQPDA